MASCQTTRVAGSSGSISSPYVKLVVTESGTATTSTLAWTLYYIAPYAASTSGGRSYIVTINGTQVKNSTFDINGKTGTHTIASGTTSAISKTTSSQSISFSVSFAFSLTWGNTAMGTRSASGSISIPAITAYTVSYNANEGTGAPGKQTKTNGVTLTLSSTKPSRTGYTFSSWNTQSNGSGTSYASGGSYTANATATLYAQWTINTYAITYDANGGSGAPSNGSKTYGVEYTISNITPTRSGYTFAGWGTSKADITPKYQAGGSYTTNGRLTLYALWTMNGNPPAVSDLVIRRVDSDGNPDEGGTRFRVTFNWTSESSISTIEVKRKLTTASDVAENWTTHSYSQSGTFGSVTSNHGGTDSPISTENSYNVRIILTDSDGRTTTINKILSNTIYPIDVLSTGDGICFGGTATKQLCEIKYQTELNGGLKCTELATLDLNNATTPGFYSSGSGQYSNLPSGVTTETFTLEVYDSGSAGQLMQRLTICNKTSSATYERFYYSSSWGGWLKAYSVGQRLMWNGASYMYANSETTQSITFPAGNQINDQPNGICLVFSRYDVDNGEAKNYYWQTFFVPKALVAAVGSNNGHMFTMFAPGFNFPVTKYLYISNTGISGHSNNNASGTTHGITYDNRNFVLRYVYGV